MIKISSFIFNKSSNKGVYIVKMIKITGVKSGVIKKTR